MSTDSKKWIVAGWVVSLLPAAALVMSGAMKIVQPGDFPTQFEASGWPIRFAVILGVVELACTAIYLIPRTSVLGAILLTGYLGGAVATHARFGDLGMFSAVGVGVFVWLGLYLRDARIRALVPFRSVG